MGGCIFSNYSSKYMAIVNNAAMNIWVDVSFQIRVLNICPGIGLQGHMVAPFLVF